MARENLCLYLDEYGLNDCKSVSYNKFESELSALMERFLQTLPNLPIELPLAKHKI